MKYTFSLFISKRWDALLASVTACIFLYFFTRHGGIGISPDSVTYYSVAVNIRAHFSFTDFNGLPLVDFPVGYAAFLAVITWFTGCSPLLFAPAINCVLFSGVIILSSYIIAGYQKSTSLYKLLFLSLLACSPALLDIYSMLWSETLFIFLVLLFFITLRRYLNTHSTPALIILSLVAAIAFDTRFAGISLLVTGGILLFFDGALPVLKKLSHILLFGTLAGSLAIINLINNHRVSGSLAGVREKALRTLAENLQQAGNVIADWFPFLQGHEKLALLVFVLLFLLGVTILCFRIIQQQYYHSYETVVACFFVVYTLFIITIASVSRFEDLSNRLLSPMYIPILLVASSWLLQVLPALTSVKKTILLLTVFITYLALQYQQYQLNAASWEGIKDAGIPGYTEDPWKRSATIQYIKENKASLPGILYSDAYDAVYFLSQIHSLPLPHKEIQKEIDVLLSHPVVCVIWLDNGANSDLVDIDFIKQHKQLVSVQKLEDGSVYVFR